MERDAMVRELKDITELDEETCLELLEAHHWNLEATVQTVYGFNTPPQDSQSEGLRRRRGNAPPSASSSSPLTADAEPRSVSLLSYILQFIRSPFRLFMSLFQFIAAFFGTLIPGISLQNLFGSGEYIRDLPAHIAETYGIHTSSILRIDLQSALSRARSQAKYLVIYLHDNDETQHTPIFIQSIFGNESVMSFLSERCLIWAADRNSPEGRMATRSFKCQQFPYLGLVISQSERRIQIIGALQGAQFATIGSDGFLAWALTLMQSFDSFFSNRRQELQNLQADQQIREEQDAAYLEALRADQEREEQKREEERQRQLEEQQKQQEAERAHAEQQAYQDALALKKQTLPDEPEEGQPSVTVAVQIPGKGRMSRKFSPSDSISCLYDFVEIQEAVSPHFSLFTSHPKTELEKNSSTFEELNLKGKVLIFCQDNAT